MQQRWRNTVKGLEDTIQNFADALNGRTPLAKTEAELANGTRGTVEALVLDPREDRTLPDDNSSTRLRFPPSIILFKRDVKPRIRFEGVPPGMIPICPSVCKFSVKSGVETFGSSLRSFRRLP